MARFTGKDLYATWIYSGGTVVLTGDQTQVSINPTVNLIDAGAGDDPYPIRLDGLKDYSISWSARIDQTNYVSVEDAIVEGNHGTMMIYPWGTADAGARKYTCPLVSSGPAVQWPYNNVVEMNCDFQADGTLVRGTV